MYGMRIPCSLRAVCIPAFLCLTQVVSGQSFSLGVKAGGRLTDDLISPMGSAASESKRYIAGPTMELGLPLRLSLEADLLYQHVGYNSGFSGPMSSSTDRVRANAWEIPVLLKYRPRFPILRPFVEAGVAPRLMSGATVDSTYTSVDFLTGAVTSGRSHGSADWSNSVGTVVGGGVQFSAGRLRLAPEVRYTRWHDTPIAASGPYGYEFHSAQNQVDLLMGISWKVR